MSLKKLFLAALAAYTLQYSAQAGLWSHICSWFAEPGPAKIEAHLLEERPNDYLIASTQFKEATLLIKDPRVDPVYVSWAKEVEILLEKHESDSLLERARVVTRKVFESFQNFEPEEPHETPRQRKKADKRFKKLTGETSFGDGFEAMPLLNKASRVRIGDLLSIRRAVCRHRSALLVATFTELGIKAQFRNGMLFKHPKGKFSDLVANADWGGHAWVLADIGGKTYLFDPMNLHIEGLNGLEVTDDIVTVDLNDTESISFFDYYPSKESKAVRTLEPDESLYKPY